MGSSEDTPEKRTVEDLVDFRKYRRAPPRAKTARDIAMIVLFSFVGLLLLSFTPLAEANPVVAEPLVVDLLKTVGSVFAGIVGAVVGYYFRAAEED